MTAEQTGIVLVPGAIATAVSMAVVGRLTNRFDPRMSDHDRRADCLRSPRWQALEHHRRKRRTDFFWPLIYARRSGSD